MMKLIFNFIKSIRRTMQPHTWEDTQQDKFNIGDEKVFSDGSTRVLNYSSSGVRRWLGIHNDDKNQSGASGNQSTQTDQMPAGIIEDPPQEITKDEWLAYNKYLTEDNPFVNCATYDEVVSMWFNKAYEYQNRLDIIEKSKEIYGDNIDDEITNVTKKFTELDNQYLAYQMYKVSYIIDEIKKVDPEFDYEAFILGSDWQGLIDYMEQMKEPQEMDYSQLYEEENGPDITT